MSKKRNKHQQGHQAPDHHQEAEALDQREPSSVYTVKVEPTTEDKDRYADEKKFRHSQLSIGKWLNVVTAVGTLTALVGLVYLYATLRAARKSANAAKEASETASKQLELSDRPWVDARIAINGPFEFNINGGNIHLGFELLNAGHLPALNTVVEALPVDSNFTGTRQPEEYVAQACRTANRMIEEYPSLGVALFPNIPFAEGETITLTAADLAKYHGKGSRFPGIILQPSVVVCVGYRPTFKSVIYHTSYIFQLSRVDASNKTSVQFKIGEDVPQAEIRTQYTYINAD
jgi:hypothetical protein